MTFHVATNTTLNPDEKTTGPTIGYNVRVAITTCVTICDYHDEKKKKEKEKKEIRPNL